MLLQSALFCCFSLHLQKYSKPNTPKNFIHKDDISNSHEKNIHFDFIDFFPLFATNGRK